ncbi:hypothetical protein KDL44_02765 [bacterium]|nr:hypothetical protein [bacterium]
MRQLYSSLALLSLLWLSACPGEPAGGRADGQPVRAEHEQAQALDADSQRARDFLLQSLREPAEEDHATLEDCWSVISRLTDSKAFEAKIASQVAESGTQPGVELLSAWLATDPAAASDYVLEQISAGNAAALQALIRFPELGKPLLLKLDLTEQSVDFQDALLLLIRNWREPGQEMLPVFKQLAGSPEPDISLRAIGYLIRLDNASEEQLSTLREAIRTEKEHFAAAVEGGKISRDPGLATAFIPRVQDVKMGEPDPEEAWKVQPYYSAYALAFIPGTDASVIRLNLLNASNTDLRWQARFGELLQGHPASFQQAMLKEGVLSPGLLRCLAPPEAVHPDLLPWYAKAIEQSEGSQRFQLVSQLSRYNEHASEPELRELVLGLLDDDSALVRGQAWLLAAQFAYPGRRLEAAAVLSSDEEMAPVKAAAACYLLSVPGA